MRPRTLFFIRTSKKKSEPGKEIEITTNKITTMSLNIGHFPGWNPYKLCPYKKNRVYGARKLILEFFKIANKYL